MSDPFIAVSEDVKKQLKNCEKITGHDLLNALDLVDTDLQDLSQALTVAEQNPARFKLSPMDLVNRRKLLEDLKQKASYMRTRVRQTSTQPGTLSYKTDILADSVQQQQQALMKEQDQQMDQLADTVGTLKEVAVVIGNELDDQTRLLNDLEENVDQTSSRLDQGMRKMKEFMKDNAVSEIFCVILLVIDFFINEYSSQEEWFNAASKNLMVTPTDSKMTVYNVQLRALLSSREAGIVIGKDGKNVASLREAASVKAGVSKMVTGVKDRILSVYGPVDCVAKAFRVISQLFLENPAPVGSRTDGQVLLRLLIAHQIIGSVIGKKGAKIKELQELSGSKITISKEMLPGSTERQVDILGAPDSIQIAIRQIGEAVSGDTPSVSTIPYVPHNRTIFDTSSLLAALPTEDNVETKTLSIPSDMVGCIIGKGGVLINHIRRLSGSRISIEKLPDADNQRLFTLTGTLTSNEKALNLLYAQLESEKKKRLNAASKKATDFASQIEKETEVAEN